MDHSRETMNSTTPHPADSAAETPLRRYFAALEQGDEGQRLLRHIRLYVHNANLEGEQSINEIALEIMQEVVVEALRSEANFDVARSPLPWLLAIAANVVKRRREKLFHRRQRETLASDLATPDEVTEEQLFDRLAAQVRLGPEVEVLSVIDIDDLLAQLSPAERYLIECYVLQDMNSAEVAETLGITPVNARVRLHRTLTKLRAIWSVQEAGQKAPDSKVTREEKQSHE